MNKKTIVVVDDVDDNREFLEALLLDAGFAVQTFASSAELLRYAPSLRPAVLVLDIRMPDLTGTDLLKSLRAYDHLRDVPAVAVTANAAAGADVGYIASGFQAYVSKPIIDLNGFTDQVRALCHVDTTIKPMRVLVVDDTEDTRELLRVMLETLGHDVIEASNGEEAVQATVGQKPELVLMDLAMPVVDGFEATRRLRSLSQFQALPIIAISAFCSNREWVDRALRVGCTDCLPKPIEWEALAAALVRNAA